MIISLTAKFWFRYVKSSLNVRKDYLINDFDEVNHQIKSKKQSHCEPVVIFVAFMEVVFSRSTHCPAEITQIKYIKQNLQY